jgi:hypothetical protein
MPGLSRSKLRSMQYAHILNLIDTYLNRLTEAREVLLSLATPSDRARNPATAWPIRMKKLRAPGKDKQAKLALEITAPERTQATAPPRTQAVARKRVAVLSPVPPRISKPTFVQDELFLPEQEQRTHENVVVEVLAEKEPKLLSPTESRPAVVKTVPRRKVTTRSKSSGPAVPRALGGMVSAAPVFIPAAQIRQERSQKMQEADAKFDSSESSAAVPLTAELLTQRWVQGLNS